MNNQIKIYPVRTLPEAIHVLQNPDALVPFQPNSAFPEKKSDGAEIDFSDVKGQWHAKRGLEVAAAGGHNALLIGPPGSGKTMLARRIPTILPDMDPQEALEATKIHSVMGLLPSDTGLLKSRPFRSPHHTASDIALVGGGSVPKAGEVTLAHHGVLFLDELPEFNRNVLEALRQPLEDHCITVSRAVKTIRFPAQFMLIGALNPCPCGWYGDLKKECHCSPHKIQKYIAKISGPLLDRIDIHLEVPSLKTQELFSSQIPESSTAIKIRTTQAREVQKKRFGNLPIFCNAQMSPRHIRHHCPVTGESQRLLKRAVEELGLSARTHDKILKIGRTIADLAGDPDIRPEHIAEAIQYRSLDRGWWG